MERGQGGKGGEHVFEPGRMPGVGLARKPGREVPEGSLGFLERAVGAPLPRNTDNGSTGSVGAQVLDVKPASEVR